MKIHGDLDFQTANFVMDAKLVLAIEAGFPEVPQAGRVIFANKRVLICVELVEGVPVWVPLTSEISSKIHTQTQASASWVITHNFNTNSVFVQIMDENGMMIIPESVDLSTINQVTVNFNSPVIGRGIVMLGNLSGLPKENILFTQSFINSTTWVVSHGLGFNPVIRCYIDNYEVQPYSVVHNSTTVATVTFTSSQTGYVSAL